MTDDFSLCQPIAMIDELSPVKEALQRATQAAGGLTGLSRIAGVSRQAVQQWDRVPEDKVKQVAEATGISRHELRPDLFRPDEHADLTNDQEMP